MLITRLGLTASGLCKVNRPVSSLLKRNVNRKTINADEEVDDKPIPFSKSKAATWKAEYSRMIPNERVWFTHYVVAGSVTIFMLYFCVLREENDIDESIYRPLPETIKGIETLFPEMDFYTKPDYVRFHEEKKAKADS